MAERSASFRSIPKILVSRNSLSGSYIFDYAQTTQPDALGVPCKQNSNLAELFQFGKAIDLAHNS
ncbi:MAG: hypothetical protein JO182_04995 [Acidobacteriaceae bacterium]|nr:hypothetical protein [Acidobacteriaceae bacterium]